MNVIIKARGAAAIAAASLSPAAAQTASAVFGSPAPIAQSELGAITGKADTNMTVRAQNSATVANNSVSGVSQTGTISFSAEAFQHMSGLALLSANTGNNVSINSSLNVNVDIRP